MKTTINEFSIYSLKALYYNIVIKNFVFCDFDLWISQLSTNARCKKWINYTCQR